MTFNYRSIRLTIDHTLETEKRIINFLSHPKHLAYVYCKETGKLGKKQDHWHIQLKTKYGPDKIKRDLNKYFPKLTGSLISTKKTKKAIPRAIAYLFKEGNYVIKWDNPEEIAAAHKIHEDFVDEEKLPTLKLKCLAHLKKPTTKEKFRMYYNTQVAEAILYWFKEKELNYPSQVWMKNTIITYWMDIHKDEYLNQRFDNIHKIYNINDPFIKEKDPAFIL